MSTQTELLRYLLARVRRELYRGKPDVTWHKQKKMVQRALTLLARQLHDKGVPMAGARYRQIMDEIITTMVRHGDLANLEWISRYVLACVQKHLQHHGDTYYEEGKNLRNSIDHCLGDVAMRARLADPTVSILTEVHDALSITKRKPKAKPVAVAQQPDLFGTRVSKL